MNDLLKKIASVFCDSGGGLFKCSLFGLIIKGGWIMLPIIALSIVSIYIIVYKLLELVNTTKYSGKWLKNIRMYMLEGDSKQVKEVCNQRKKAILSKVIIKALNRSMADRNLKDIEGMVEAIGKDEIYKLEMKIPTLGIIAGSAPMMGFLGTVTGLIQAFVKISQYKTQINPSMISGGIYEAMITTAAGLVVGIVAYIGYNYLIIRIRKVVHNLEYNLTELMNALKQCIEKTRHEEIKEIKL